VVQESRRPRREDEPLFEISTDKVDAEIPSPIAGVLTEIKVEEGKTVTINTVVGVIGGAAPSRCSSGPGRRRSHNHREAPMQLLLPRLLPLPTASTERIRSSRWSGASRGKTSSIWSTLAGTGSTGRITKDDVLRFLTDFGPGWRPPVPEPPVPETRSRRRSRPLSLSPAPRSKFPKAPFP